MPRRDYKDLKYATPQLPTRLPARQFEQKKMADEKFVKWNPKPAPPPVTMRDIALPEFSSLTPVERGMGFDSDSVTYRGLVVRRLLYREVPIWFAALGHCAPSLVKLQEAVNRG